MVLHGGFHGDVDIGSLVAVLIVVMLVVAGVDFRGGWC